MSALRQKRSFNGGGKSNRRQLFPEASDRLLLGVRIADNSPARRRQLLPKSQRKYSGTMLRRFDQPEG